MRGKECHRKNRAKNRGITPAYAGKRILMEKTKRSCKDHPRVCGEKPSGKMSRGLRVGSPPRMRGKGIYPCRVVPDVGITPAYAGKSLCCTASLPQRRDHPRVCGEKSLMLAENPPPGGSPPRMRGKEWSIWTADPAERITPAYAGKSPSFPLAGGPLEDHPRVCGEKSRKPCSFTSCIGITPAYAGKSIVAFWGQRR